MAFQGIFLSKNAVFPGKRDFNSMKYRRIDVYVPETMPEL